MTGAMKAMELGCLLGVCGMYKSLVYEDFRTACQSMVWGLLNSGLSLHCWGRGQVLTPCYLHGPSQLCFWILSLSLCRQKLLYKAVGVEEGVPIGKGKTRGCQALININYTKAWGCSAFVGHSSGLESPPCGGKTARAAWGFSSLLSSRAEQACPLQCWGEPFAGLCQLRLWVLGKEL